MFLKNWKFNQKLKYGLTLNKYTNLKNSVFYISSFVITYLIYVYPYDVLGSLLFEEKIFKLSTLIYLFFIYSVLFYFYTKTTTFPIFKFIAFEGLGVGFLSFFILNLGLITGFIFNINNFFIGTSCLLLILIFTILSFINAKSIAIRKITINSPKIKKYRKIIFLSDVHLGSNSEKKLETIIGILNEMNFDYLFIGGDLIDSSSFDFKKLSRFKSIKSNIYYISGNHEYSIKNSKEIFENLDQFNIKFLDNECVELDGLNLIGISDNLSDQEKLKIIKSNFSKSLFNITLIHKPNLWRQVQKYNDLMLSGHTHNGQIFPFNFFVKLKYFQNYGFYEHVNSKLYVSSGVSCWGPKMRLGSKNEIIEITISNN